MSKPIVFKTAFGTYVADEIIGQGGTATVYKAVDESKYEWAIKTLDPSKATKEKRKRFKNEWLFCSRNLHPNILTVSDHGLIQDDKENSAFFIMPKYDCSLRKLMSDGVKHENILRLFGQILDGVEAAHLQKVFHRDLKPENILYDSQKNALVVADFGIAHFIEEDIYTTVETAPRARLANFQYASPEQRKQGSTVDHRADIYSLGLILNEMFTGEIPQGTSYKTIGSVSGEYAYLDDIVSEMLRQSPDERPVSIERIKNELIARKNEFITHQKLSQLKKEVIPVSEIDDPLINDPPRLIAADWNNNKLILKLSCQVNEKWIWALHNMGGTYSSVLGKDPHSFDFRGDSARVKAEHHEVQQIIDYFKEWLPKANMVYKRRIEREKKQEEQAQREKLQQEIEQQVLRAKVLGSIRI